MYFKNGFEYLSTSKPNYFYLKNNDFINRLNRCNFMKHKLVEMGYDKNKTDEDVESVIDEICPDGLETYYIHNDNQGVKRAEIQKWGDLAKRKGLFETIGSDFHNNMGARVLLGFVGEDMEFSDNEVTSLLKNLLADGKNKIDDFKQIKN